MRSYNDVCGDYWIIMVFFAIFIGVSFSLIGRSIFPFIATIILYLFIPLLLTFSDAIRNYKWYKENPEYV